MAVMIPESIGSLDSATSGEKGLFKILKYNLSNDYREVKLSNDNLYNRKYPLKAVRIKAAGGTAVMGENYRNTKQILDFAHIFLSNGSLKESTNEENNNFIITPDNSLREGVQPDLIYCENFNEEISKIAMDVIQLKQLGVDYGDICIAYVHSSYKDINYLNTIQEVFNSKGIPYFVISKSDNTKTKFKLDTGTVGISTIHSIKGLDFKHVFICGINDRLLDNIEESKKLLYVGMTRARDVLKVTYSVDNAIVDDLIKAKINMNVATREEIRELVDITREERRGGLFSRIRGLFVR